MHTESYTGRGQTIRLMALTVISAVVGLVLVAPTATASDGHFVRPTTPPPAQAVPVPLPEHDVRIEWGQDLQQVVDSHPPGTRYLLGAGVHREQQVVPSDGDQFYGEDGAVLSGARVLPATSFSPESGHFVIDGQTQQGFVHGLSATLPGHERDAHPEELFVDGQRRLRHVGSVAALTTGTWFFDYDNDRIWLADDPWSFRSIETSTTPFAFGGTGVRDVVIDNVIVEKYASPFQFGAIGGDQHNRFTYGWTVRNVVARHNHGVGILVGPGMQVFNSRAHHNGQMGMGGNGWHPETGYSARVLVTNTEIDNNLLLGFDWGHEGGGTKFSIMRGMDFVNNWVHHNNGPGVWFDVDNRDVVIASNLVEDNANQGIFYEVSTDAQIYWNTVRRNSTAVSGGAAASAIDISNSSRVEVFENTVSDSPTGIYLRYDHARADEGDTSDVTVRNNDVQMADGMTGMLVSNTTDPDRWFQRSGNRFLDNTFRVDSLSAHRFTWGGNFEHKLSAGEWSSMHPDQITEDVRPGAPTGATPFEGPVGPGF